MKTIVIVVQLDEKSNIERQVKGGGAVKWTCVQVVRKKVKNIFPYIVVSLNSAAAISIQTLGGKKNLDQERIPPPQLSQL